MAYVLSLVPVSAHLPRLVLHRARELVPSLVQCKRQRDPDRRVQMTDVL